MHQIPRCARMIAAASAVLVCLVLAPTALADSRPLHLGVTKVQFGSSTCLNDTCSLVQGAIEAKVTSNVASGVGTLYGTLTIDNSPGGTCNIIDESDAFVFDNGTIFVTAHHEDCAIHGLRIDGPFEVTGGTGSFQGASGAGQEFAAAATALTVLFNGTIDF